MVVLRKLWAVNNRMHELMHAQPQGGVCEHTHTHTHTPYDKPTLIMSTAHLVLLFLVNVKFREGKNLVSHFCFGFWQNTVSCILNFKEGFLYHRYGHIVHRWEYIVLLKIPEEFTKLLLTMCLMSLFFGQTQSKTVISKFQNAFWSISLECEIDLLKNCNLSF